MRVCLCSAIIADQSYIKVIKAFSHLPVGPLFWNTYFIHSVCYISLHSGDFFILRHYMLKKNDIVEYAER